MTIDPAPTIHTGHGQFGWRRDRRINKPVNKPNSVVSPYFPKIVFA